MFVSTSSSFVSYLCVSDLFVIIYSEGSSPGMKGYHMSGWILSVWTSLCMPLERKVDFPGSNVGSPLLQDGEG